MENKYAKRFVPLMSDAGFKAVFRYEKNKNLLIGLLNFFLPEEAQVEDIVEYCDREQEIENIEDKRTILDLICKGKDGSHYLVEVQKEFYNDYFKRLMFYASRKFVSQLHRGEDYETLKPVYVLNILNHELQHKDMTQWDENHLISHYKFIEERTHENIVDPTIMITFVEMPRFAKTAEECESELDCLLYWFVHSGDLDMIPEIIKKSPYTSELATATEFAAMTDLQKIQFDKDMINEMDRQYQLRKKYETGHEVGYEKGYGNGLEKGKEEGREEGIEKGRDEKALEIASKLKKRGYSLEDIAEDTGLTIEEIAAL